MGKPKMRDFRHPIGVMSVMVLLAILQSMGYPFTILLYMTVLAHVILVSPLSTAVLAVVCAHIALALWAFWWLNVTAVGGHLLLLSSYTLAMAVMAGMVRRFGSLKAGLESGIIVYAGLGLALASAGYLSIEFWINQALQAKSIDAVTRGELLHAPLFQEIIGLYNYGILSLFWLRGVFALLLAYGFSSLRVQKGGFKEIFRHLRLHGGFAVLLAMLAVLQFYYHPVGVMQSFFVLPVVVLSLFGLIAAHFATQQGALSVYGLGTLYFLLLLPHSLGLWLVGFIGLLDAFYNLRCNTQFELRKPGQWVQTFGSLRMKRNLIWA